MLWTFHTISSFLIWIYVKIWSAAFWGNIKHGVVWFLKTWKLSRFFKILIIISFIYILIFFHPRKISFSHFVPLTPIQGTGWCTFCLDGCLCKLLVDLSLNFPLIMGKNHRVHIIFLSAHFNKSYGPLHVCIKKVWVVGNIFFS